MMRHDMNYINFGLLSNFDEALEQPVVERDPVKFVVSEADRLE